ncbi:cytochrome P450 [Hyaloscypha variabilis]
MSSFLMKFTPISVSLLTVGLVLTWYTVSSVGSWYRLRHIPGPSFSTLFSYLWIALTTYSGKQYWILRDLNIKLGPLVRIGPNEIITDDLEILRKINSLRGGYGRDEAYLVARFIPDRDNTLTILDPATHASNKAKIAAAYSGRDISAFESRIDIPVEILLRLLRRKYVHATEKKEPPLLNLELLSKYFTLDIITSLGFGKARGYLSEETDHYDYIRNFKDLWPLFATSAAVLVIRKIISAQIFLRLFGSKPTDRSGCGAMKGMVAKFVGTLFESNTKEEQDMLGSFINHGMSREHCESESVFMIFGGWESTASTIRSILVHTMTTPRFLEKLRQEIDEAVRRGGVSTPILFEQAKRLPYLQAILYEGLRIRPAILAFFPKVVPAGGDQFHNKHIPAGTSVGVNISSVLHSKKLFGVHPELFSPERFMNLDKAKHKEMERNVELAFGQGQWTCVGKTLAFMNLNKVVFEVFKVFDLQLVEPMKPCNTQTYGVFLDDGLLVKATERS